jgi:Txe/YoeB family toxin of Txe-Axe toxin-antitoxin module
MADQQQQQKYKNLDEKTRNMQKRINELINSRFMPGQETPEKMFEKI